jgi:antitoxin (DNA-binding transcriptional repressor) of toxin-antitoxin stability system
MRGKATPPGEHPHFFCWSAARHEADDGGIVGEDADDINGRALQSDVRPALRRGVLHSAFRIAVLHSIEESCILHFREGSCIAVTAPEDGSLVRHAAPQGPVIVTARGRRVAALQPFDAATTRQRLPDREAAIRKRSRIPVDSATYLAEDRGER